MVTQFLRNRRDRKGKREGGRERDVAGEVIKQEQKLESLSNRFAE